MRPSSESGQEMAVFGNGNNNKLKIFSGRANRPLAENIARVLGVPLGRITIDDFPDQETSVRIDEDVRGRDVFLVQSTCTPVNQHLMELLIMLDAFKRASPARITAVLPYYGYARQDRKDKGRVPISAKLVANLITRAGADRVLALDLHAAQIQGFFDIPVDHLFAAPVMAEYFNGRYDREQLIIVSPDAGGVERARSFAKRMNVPLAIIDKRRTDANVAEVMNIIGDVRGKYCLMVDDLVDTAGTMVKGVEALLEAGATGVTCAATHAVLSGQAVERICASPMEELVVTNSIPHKAQALKCSKIRTLSVAPLLARAIQSIHEGGSISTLFI